MPTATCPTETAKLSETGQIIENQIQEIVNAIKNDVEADAKEINKDAPSGEENKIGIDFKIDWVDKEFSLHVPTVTLEDQVIGRLHLPEFKMEDKEIIFHTPSTRMVDKKVGEYPSIVCRGLSCKTVMKDIIISVPETFMQEHKISFGVPTVVMKEQDLIMGVPVFGTTLHTFILSMPKIEVITISQASENLKKKSDELNDKYTKREQDERNNIKNLVLSNIEPPHTALFNCIKSGIEAMRSAALTNFDAGIATLNAGISNLKAQGVDSDNETLKQMEESLRLTTEQRNEQSNIFDSKITEINEQQRTSLETMTRQITEQ